MDAFGQWIVKIYIHLDRRLHIFNLRPIFYFERLMNLPHPYPVEACLLLGKSSVGDIGHLGSACYDHTTHYFPLKGKGLILNETRSRDVNFDGYILR